MINGIKRYNHKSKVRDCELNWDRGGGSRMIIIILHIEERGHFANDGLNRISKKIDLKLGDRRTVYMITT